MKFQPPSSAAPPSGPPPPGLLPGLAQPVGRPPLGSRSRSPRRSPASPSGAPGTPNDSAPLPLASKGPPPKKIEPSSSSPHPPEVSVALMAASEPKKIGAFARLTRSAASTMALEGPPRHPDASEQTDKAKQISRNSLEERYAALTGCGWVGEPKGASKVPRLHNAGPALLDDSAFSPLTRHPPNAPPSLLMAESAGADEDDDVAPKDQLLAAALPKSQAAMPQPHWRPLLVPKSTQPTQPIQPIQPMPVVVDDVAVAVAVADAAARAARDLEQQIQAVEARLEAKSRHRPLHQGLEMASGSQRQAEAAEDVSVRRLDVVTLELQEARTFNSNLEKEITEQRMQSMSGRVDQEAAVQARRAQGAMESRLELLASELQSCGDEVRSGARVRTKIATIESSVREHKKRLAMQEEKTASLRAEGSGLDHGVVAKFQDTIHASRKRLVGEEEQVENWQSWAQEAHEGEQSAKAEVHEVREASVQAQAVLKERCRTDAALLVRLCADESTLHRNLEAEREQRQHLEAQQSWLAQQYRHEIQAVEAEAAEEARAFRGVFAELQAAQSELATADELAYRAGVSAESAANNASQERCAAEEAVVATWRHWGFTEWEAESEAQTARDALSARVELNIAEMQTLRSEVAVAARHEQFGARLAELEAEAASHRALFLSEVAEARHWHNRASSAERSKQQEALADEREGVARELSEAFTVQPPALSTTSVPPPAYVDALQAPPVPILGDATQAPPLPEQWYAVQVAAQPLVAPVEASRSPHRLARLPQPAQTEWERNSAAATTHSSSGHVGEVQVDVQSIERLRHLVSSELAFWPPEDQSGARAVVDNLLDLFAAADEATALVAPMQQLVRLKIHSVDLGYMDRRLKGVQVSSAEFRRAFLELASRSPAMTDDRGRWAKSYPDVQARGLAKEGMAIISPKGVRAKMSAKLHGLAHAPCGLRWPGGDAWHDQALALAGFLDHAVVLVKSGASLPVHCVLAMQQGRVVNELNAHASLA